LLPGFHFNEFDVRSKRVADGVAAVPDSDKSGSKYAIAIGHGDDLTQAILSDETTLMIYPWREVFARLSVSERRAFANRREGPRSQKVTVNSASGSA